MNPSFSILMPVQNVEGSVRATTIELLEIASQFGTDFEIHLVDDGSNDDTPLVLAELSHQFPQVDCSFELEPRGLLFVAETYIERLSGDIVFLQNGAMPLSSTAYRKLWELRHEAKLITTRSPTPTPPAGDDVLRHLVEWGAQVPSDIRQVDAPSGLQMIRRRLLRPADRDARRRADRKSVPSPNVATASPLASDWSITSSID